MTFRTRLLVAFLAAVLVPVILFAVMVGNEMTRRLGAQYERRVDALAGVIAGDLQREGARLSAAADAIARAAADDNRLRAAALEAAGADRRYLLDYAPRAMALAGLDMLQIQDERGRILSSGHFRNDYDRLDPGLPELLASTPEQTALVEARAPDGTFLALARLDSLWMGGRLFFLVAGVDAGERFLSRLERDADIDVVLLVPDSASAGAPIQRDLTLPFIGLERRELDTATLRISHDLAGLDALRAGVWRWFVVVLVVTLVVATLLVTWLSLRLSRPLAELAGKTERVDLDRLDVEFDTGRRDEVGALSRLLAAMTGRLRVSAARIRDAERRATLGELARQVNHDIKNGLTPIRNVLRHLAELSRDDPGAVAPVLRDRQETLDSSVAYLENLAASYARLSPRAERESCDLNDVARRAVDDRRGIAGVEVRAELAAAAPVNADPVWLRRILENLLDNAVDSIESPPGVVTVTTAVSGDRVIMTVADTGSGLDEERAARVFDDFFTTREKGTGLGLSIVRRLVMDLDGTVRVESTEGEGSRFIVELPRMRKDA